MKKLGRAIAQPMPYPFYTAIYATCCVPMLASISFPPSFTQADRDRAWEALRGIYDEVTDREDNQKDNRDESVSTPFTPLGGRIAETGEQIL